MINLVVGATTGGGYDAYTRLLARSFGRYLPGNPTVIVQNMPGIGSLKAVLYLDATAPKDGSVITAFNPHGRVREHWQNEQENARLAGQLLAAGAALSRAVGGAIGGQTSGSPDAPSDTAIAEASFLVWGVDEEVVAQAAREFGQEAYFVIEDEEVSVVGAFTERTETILRRG
jgi:hypothetical protein